MSIIGITHDRSVKLKSSLVQLILLQHNYLFANLYLNYFQYIKYDFKDAKQVKIIYILKSNQWHNVRGIVRFFSSLKCSD